MDNTFLIDTVYPLAALNSFLNNEQYVVGAKTDFIAQTAIRGNILPSVGRFRPRSPSLQTV
jgi:hypothetical protein